MENLKKRLESWQGDLRKGTDFDRWGQPVEATEVYKRLSRELSAAMVNSDCPLSLQQKKTCGLLMASLDLREKSLRRPAEKQEISLESLKKFDSMLTDLLVEATAAQTKGNEKNNPNLPGNKNNEEQRTLPLEKVLSCTESLLPRPSTEPGKTYLTIKIQKIGVKDAGRFLYPIITISVKNLNGIDLSPRQSTPAANLVEDPHILFNADVEIQNAIEDLPEGFAVFFEFKHYKPRKHILSTKCFSFIEKDEIQSGPAVLELLPKKGARNSNTAEESHLAPFSILTRSTG